MYVVGAVLVVVVSATVTGVVEIAIDRDLITAINTALNLASWVLLIRAQRKLRHDIAPTLDHVEEVITTTLDTREYGGRRRHDPPAEETP